MSSRTNTLNLLIVLAYIATVVTGCSGGGSGSGSSPASYTIGGSVTGLAGTGLELQNNSGDDLQISANGSFVFASALTRGDSYNVSVKTQPGSPNQTCVVAGGSGNVADRDITSIAITCTTNTYTIGGSVTGLGGAGLVLQNNGGNDLAVSSNGNFTFSSTVLSDNNYNITVLTQPSAPNQICTVSNGNGIATLDVTSITITCTNTYTVGGTVTGLAGSGLVLQNNADDDLFVSSNGNFTFAAALLADSNYNISVLNQPINPRQTCDVSKGSGITTRDIASVVITCTTNTYTISGTVTGLLGSGLVLQNNDGDKLLIPGNGSFTFASAVASGSGYDVTVETHPSSPDQTCVIINGFGDVVDQDIASVVVSCSTFQVGVVVTGLESGETLTLQNNGGDDLLITGNGGPFIFDTLIHDLLPYIVTISVQPGTSTQQCLVLNGSGTIASADVLDIAVVCPNVAALYPANGVDWNDYVNNNGGNGFEADDTVCDGVGNSYASCLHGGEMRLVTLDGITSCSGITADDALSAFNWVCDDSTGAARIISTSLRQGAALSSLIDFTTAQWRENAVTINQSGNLLAKTPTTTWWSNSIIVANSGGSLNSEGVIYIVTTDPSANYSIDADKVGIIIQPGLEMTGAGGGSSIHADEHNYLWIEGQINASNNNNGILWDSVAYSVMRATQVSGTVLGSIGNIVLRNCTNNRMSNIHIVHAAAYGLILQNSSNNKVADVITANSNNAGIYLTNSHNNSLTGITTANNDSASNAEGGGILFAGSADNTVINATVVNNRLSGFALSSSPNNLLMNIVGANNYTSFYIVNNSNKLTAANLVTANNSRHGVYLGNVSNNYFTGVLKIGDNAGTNCRVENAPTAPGLINLKCTDTGIDGSSIYTGQLSDAALETDVTTGLSYIGKILFDDPINTSDTHGGANLAAITDWTKFENSYRSWGLDGDSYPSLNNKGPLPSCDDYATINEADCSANGGTWRTDGRIWDWSLALDDNGDNGGPVLHEVLALPSADDTITHTWSDAASTTFLRNAMEMPGDAIGDDDGLCESNEACIFTPNIGGYQGEGDLIPAGTIVDSVSGGLTGVLLYRYEMNGH